VSVSVEILGLSFVTHATRTDYLLLLDILLQKQPTANLSQHLQYAVEQDENTYTVTAIFRGKGYGVGMATSEHSAKHAAALATYRRFLRDGVPQEGE